MSLPVEELLQQRDLTVEEELVSLVRVLYSVPEIDCENGPVPPARLEAIGIAARAILRVRSERSLQQAIGGLTTTVEGTRPGQLRPGQLRETIDALRRLEHELLKQQQELRELAQELRALREEPEDGIDTQ